MLRPLERRLVVAVGLLALATGLALFLAPGTMNDLWPWPLTPLTARVIGATFCLGGAGVGVWFDPRWSSMRVMLQVEILMLVLMLIAAVRARDELIRSHALAWPLLLGSLLMLAGSAYLWLTYEHHPRPVRGPRGLDELGRRAA